MIHHPAIGGTLHWWNPPCCFPNGSSSPRRQCPSHNSGLTPGPGANWRCLEVRMIWGWVVRSLECDFNEWTWDDFENVSSSWTNYYFRWFQILDCRRLRWSLAAKKNLPKTPKKSAWKNCWEIWSSPQELDDLPQRTTTFTSFTLCHPHFFAKLPWGDGNIMKHPPADQPEVRSA